MADSSKPKPREDTCPHCGIGLQVEFNNGHKVLGCPKCGYMEPYEEDEKPAAPTKPPAAPNTPGGGGRP